MLKYLRNGPYCVSWIREKRLFWIRFCRIRVLAGTGNRNCALCIVWIMLGRFVKRAGARRSAACFPATQRYTQLAAVPVVSSSNEKVRGWIAARLFQRVCHFVGYKHKHYYHVPSKCIANSSTLFYITFTGWFWGVRTLGVYYYGIMHDDIA